MNIRGNTILITGGSSGIGFEMAKQLLEKDNRIIITGRNSEKLKKAEDELKDVTAIQSDVSSPDDIQKLKDRMVKEFPDLNILINNAGIMRIINLQDHKYSEAELTAEIDVNVKGPVWMSDAFLAILKGKENSAIVNVSSGLAFVPLPISPVYCSTKAALHSYTQSLRVQLRKTGIKVFELAPPATQTDLLGDFDEADMKGISIMSVERMVGVFVKGLLKNTYEIRPGQSNQMKFMSRFFPKFIFKQMSKTVDRMLK